MWSSKGSMCGWKLTSAAFTTACLVVTTCTVQRSNAKTVVSVPVPFTSHVKYHSNVARALTGRGHKAWLAIPNNVLEKDYLDTHGLNTIPYDTLPGLEETFDALMIRSYFDNKPGNVIELCQLSKEIFNVMLKNDSFIRTIKQLSPDLIVIDNLPNAYVVSIIPYRLGIPFAFMGSYYDLPTLRVPFSPADSAFNFLTFSNKMTFLQRLQNTFSYIQFAVSSPSFTDDAVSMYAPEMKYIPLHDLVRQAEIFLVELDHVLDYPKPILPNVKLIGGTATGPAKALPPEFQSFMDSAKEGVVIVSFGSYVLGLPKHISDKILQVLLQLPMKSVFRSNLTSPDPKKILTALWIPQNDLLGHPHTKVFVSHCGKNGQYEALYHAVPIVATPLFTDQPYNAERARVKGFAEVLDLNTCTAEQMRSSILTVANEPRYNQAVVKRSRLFRELYGVPMETAAYWLDHVMEYGGDYMRSAGQQMPLYQYVLLDVFLFILAVLALVVGFVCVFCKIIHMRLRKKKIKTA
ncbi:2-hydroxyacylsphingosine 1-beta-galactosyltransferase-like [Babylonia areolata]|uniref:2-hydroxyacylsphingosine 1-beta-galactosyltransferase-like n=1 Tax=Babylonia areolata TaxID=304850 RepID=UPI003FD53E27